MVIEALRAGKNELFSSSVIQAKQLNRQRYTKQLSFNSELAQFQESLLFLIEAALIECFCNLELAVLIAYWQE